MDVTLNIDKTISPNDGMFAGNPEHYFSCGQSALQVLLKSIEWSGMAPPARILDFGAGAGRVTRWLKSAFPAASISCCDIRDGDMRFLRTQFGVQAWTVSTDIDALKIPGQYDLIWSGSVITHLSATTARKLIDKLLSACSVGGLLVVSFHGPFAIERQEKTAFRYIDDEGWKDIKRGYDSAGYGYADYQGQNGYGISVCTPTWMINLVNALPGCRLVLLASTAWDHHHDVIAIQRLT